ncbi:hypothetical protein Kpol_460p13 [Vanderwaltozyma polyspora DSM 70294]|uniref:Exocyst complex component SEC15 n=1 Tax=Vanderwaltozyma polyspora (strain ATCC 22028 / DSM 70294 / BCRC 21397 / CBS 2163 / NBRC 10782 / NRRL Y-8283 / UCD 57-17) TaxID=436907 RepID=A7TQS9_VANPO|nr:uncharacterized protein Kpol_460p13 [Vanderwaltozyma polyspora DSM 70294]EDO15378.1 hypothetical protein Kpol_460p13 [Vanderwaltozyma polyspora DSM 70294]
MELESQSALTQEFQKLLLNTNSSSKRGLEGNKKNKTSTSNENGGLIIEEDLFQLDTETFDKWVPLIRKAVERDELNPVVDELYNSIDENFQGLENQILQESQINDKMKISIGQISTIQGIIEGSLTKEIVDLQEHLSLSTNDVIRKKQIYVNNKKTSLKISETTIVISKVLRILELANNCQELIVEKDFFKALQNLDNLEKIYLQEFKNYNFQFLKELYDSIPFLKSSIKDECINLIRNSFNLNLGKNLSKVGDSFFKVYRYELLPKWLETRDSMKLGNFNFNSPIEISLREQSTLEKLDLRLFFHLDEFHDSILIFKSLDKLDYLFTELTNEYAFRKNKIIYPLSWKKSPHSIAADPLNNNPINDEFSQQISVEFLKEYFLKILGFLLYDINLNRETDYIIVNNNLNATNEFWDGLMHRLIPYLKQFINHNLNTDEELVEFKDFMCIYISILENYALNTEPLYNCLVSVFEKYCHLAVESFRSEFEILLNDDDFMPLTIQDRSLYEKVIKICWMKEDDEVLSDNQNLSEFSVTLPFSPLYPMTCTLIKKTYSKLTAFISNHFRHELHRLNSILVKTVDSLFNNVVNQKIRDKLDTTSREEIAQILINLDYFIIAANEFSKLMARENIMQNPDIEIRLSSIKQYEDSRKYAESKLITLIDTKISDILETVSLDWESNDLRDDPDFSIVDIAQFLEMMFSSTLMNLPYSVQTLLIFREFDSLTTKFLEMLLNETPDHITKESVMNFEVDMNYLKRIIPRIFPSEDEDYEDSLHPPQTPVSQTNFSSPSSSLIENNIKSLEATFTDLNQCIDLLKSGSFEEYSDPEIRMRKYARIRPEDATQLLKKVQAPPPIISSPNTSSSSHGSSSPREALNGRRIAKFFNRT